MRLLAPTTAVLASSEGRLRVHSKQKVGWEQSDSEPTLFRKEIDGSFCYLCTYVDNLFVGFPKESADRDILLRRLGEHYRINDIGKVKYALG